MKPPPMEMENASKQRREAPDVSTVQTTNTSLLSGAFHLFLSFGIQAALHVQRSVISVLESAFLSFFFLLGKESHRVFPPFIPAFEWPLCPATGGP